MTNLFSDVFILFAKTLGAQDALLPYAKYLNLALPVIAGLCCFIGYKLFRAIFAALAFMLMSIGTCMLLKNIVDWNVVVTAIAVFGTLTMFFAFNARKLGALFICGFFGWALAAVFTQSLWICAVAALVLALCSMYAPKHLVIASTSVWGALFLARFITTAFGFDHPLYVVVGIVLLCAIGVIIQELTNVRALPIQIIKPDSRLYPSNRAAAKTPHISNIAMARKARAAAKYHPVHSKKTIRRSAMLDNKGYCPTHANAQKRN
ncbi:MAG: hypothetical protein RR232_08325 [Clostridia bacterium]